MCPETAFGRTTQNATAISLETVRDRQRYRFLFERDFERTRAFRGVNNSIGKQATTDVFLSIAEIVKDFIVTQDAKKITIKNASKRKVVIALATDPDIRIQEEFEGKLRNKVAIEIKGGTDNSNAHNRAGEAEKSHTKAKNAGFRDFWTIISKTGVNQQKLRDESKTTNSWFDVAQVLAREGPDWNEFRSRFAGDVGIPIS